MDDAVLVDHADPVRVIEVELAVVADEHASCLDAGLGGRSLIAVGSQLAGPSHGRDDSLRVQLPDARCSRVGDVQVTVVEGEPSRSDDGRPGRRPGDGRDDPVDSDAPDALAILVAEIERAIRIDRGRMAGEAGRHVPCP